PWPRRRALRGAGTIGALLFIAAAVIGFADGWSQGNLVIDGPGMSIYVRLILEHWREYGEISYWMPELWAGSPVWALGPILPALMLVPLAASVGPEEAVRIGGLAAQVAGGWGAFVLARGMWGRTAAAMVSGVVYAIHPIAVSHIAFAGAINVGWVMAATPWFAWALRGALQTGRGRFVVLGGLAGGFAILQQAEHAYALVLLGAVMVLVEMTRARSWNAAGRVALRAGAVVAVAGGTVAHWLLPFLTMAKDFVLTPADAVQETLVSGLGGFVGRRPELWLVRSEGISGPVTFDLDLIVGSLYLGWSCVLVTLVTVALLPRHDDDGHLTGIMLASALGLWLSTSGVPLAQSGLAERGQVIPFVLVGALSGLLLGSLLRRAGGRTAVLGGPAAAVFLVAAPYLTPFLTLREVLPFLDSIRFPRFYPLAMLGVAVGAAYPIVLLERRTRAHLPRAAPVLAAATGLVVLGLFVIDTEPYRGLYHLQPPVNTDEVYAQAVARLPASGEYRVATPFFGDPRPVEELLARGQRLSVGWPHPLAGRELFKLTGEGLFGPTGYRDNALGLAATAYLVPERFERRDQFGAVLRNAEVQKNERALPMARAYDRVVQLAPGDDFLATELAVSLAQKGIAVVNAGPGASEVAATLGAGSLTATDDPCEAGSPRVPDRLLGGDLAAACTLH
ncbi:MAG: hypothetical protein ACRD0M_06550, partial [Acidimicrobiales bacterium]